MPSDLTTTNPKGKIRTKHQTEEKTKHKKTERQAGDAANLYKRLIRKDRNFEQEEPEKTRKTKEVEKKKRKLNSVRGKKGQ